MAENPMIAAEGYLETRLRVGDPELGAALADSKTAGLPEVQVTPLQGRLLEILARSIWAKRILEVGTLGGYSTTCMARALPKDGTLVTLEIDPQHAKVAQRNLERAGVAERVEVRVGPALGSLAALIAERPPPFDMVFIDADKANNLPYFEAALELTRPGSLIVIDNVVREGKIADPANTETSTEGTRRVLERMGEDRRVLATAIQTVGPKGHDGFAVALVLSPRAGVGDPEPDDSGSTT